MNAFWGADSDQLEQHAHRVSSAAERLVELQDELGALVLDETLWHGPDATAFREQWRARALRPSHAAREELHRLAGELRENAESQDQASSPGGTTGAPPTGIRPLLGTNTMGTGHAVPAPGPGPDWLPLGTRAPLTLELSDLTGWLQVCPPADPRVFLRTQEITDVIGCTGLPPLH